MRIISPKYSDYYDSLLDPSKDAFPFYLRIPSKHEIDLGEVAGIGYKDWRIWSLDRHIRNFNRPLFLDVTYKCILIGFCGKIHKCLRIKPVASSTDVLKSDFVPYFIRYFYNLESMLIFLNKQYINDKKVKLKIEDIRKDKQLLDFLNFDVKNYETKFQEYKVPIFSIEFCDEDRDVRLITNPRLKNYEFYKIYDVQQTFQEISMYIGGVLGGSSPPMVEIEDKYRIEAHGFDKYSFRRLPEN